MSANDNIAAVVTKMDDVDAEMWEISENLHRSGLTALQRSEQIERWRELKAIKVRENPSPEPKEQGVRKPAGELGIDPKAEAPIELVGVGSN